MESDPNRGAGQLHRRLSRGWRELSGVPWAAIPRRVNGWLVDTVDGLIQSGFDEADKGIAFGGVVMVLLFIILPVLALINMLTGGSVFLFWYFVSLLAALAFLNFSGETNLLKVLNGFAAVYLGVSLIIIIPVYALRAFTEVSIHNVFSHAVLKSPLVAVFWYLAAYGVGLMLDTAVRFAGGNFRNLALGRFVHGGLAAVPIAFVLTFAALLAGHLAVFEQNPARSWTLVLVSTGITALSLPGVLRVMGLSRGVKTGGLGMPWALGLGFVLSTILSTVVAFGMHFEANGALSWSEAVNVLVGLSPDGKRIFLGPDFWVMHLPFLPWLAFVFTIVASLMGKAIAGAFEWTSTGGLQEGERPFLASALLSGAFVVLFWSVSVLV
ncbi:MAG: hypothetical protein HN377_14175 [Alphaproteobacteria bacterium]|nr:hypothetical protein [Alphaproteobacteria bacterium]